MAGKDMAEKALEAYDDVFSDIVNNLIFNGKNVVLESELEQGRERSIYQGEQTLREQERDSSKYWKHNNIRIAFFGLENETQAEDDMPFRVIGYDGAAYRDQISYKINNSGKRQKHMTRYPVITLVLYFGYKQHWDKARSLYDVFNWPDSNSNDNMRSFINDYRINLFEIAFLSDEQVAGFTSDFKFVADFFVQMRKYGEYRGSTEKLCHAREVLQLMGYLTNDDRFSIATDTIDDGKEITNMCEALDIIEARGEKRGIAIGEKRGIVIGEKRGFVKALSELVKDGILSVSDAAKRADMSISSFMTEAGIK